MKSSYIIAGSPRSGTTLLSDLLRSNGLGEPKEHFKATEVGQNFSKAIALGETTEEFAERLVRSCEHSMFGTKLMWPWLNVMLANSTNPCQEHHQLLEKILPSARYIYVSRRDRVGQAISLIRAMETNEWIALKNDPIGENHSWPKGIDPGRIHRTMLSLLFDNLAWKQQFSKGRIEHLSIIYEDLVENTRVVMESVGRYLAGESFVLRSVTTNILMQRDANTEAIRNEFLSSPTVK